MFHHPSCPYYRLSQCQQCVFTGPLMQPQSNTLYILPNPSPSSLPVTRPCYSTDAIQSARVIQKGIISRVADHLTERRVHFEPSHHTRKRNTSMCADGTYDITYERSRTTRHSLPAPTPDITFQARPRSDPPALHSILRPVEEFLRDLPTHDLRPTQPTIYIVTFAADTIPNRTRNVMRLLDQHVPARNPPIPHLHTIDARSFTPPSQRICERYSGISPIVQDVVMQDARARHAVKNAVAELLGFGLHERGKMSGGKREVSMSVCCHMGTHRSVAIGERIAQGVKSEVGKLGVEEGVRIVVRHVHRIKGRGDPF